MATQSLGSCDAVEESASSSFAMNPANAASVGLVTYLSEMVSFSSRSSLMSRRTSLMHISKRSTGQMTCQLNYPSSQKISLLSVLPCSDEVEILRKEPSECPLQLLCFEFIQIRSGRG